MYQVTIQEVESHIVDMLGMVLRGKEIIITDHDTPVVKMTPVARGKERHPKFGSAKGKIRMADDFNETPEEPRDLWGSAKGKIWIADDSDETPEGFE